MQCREVRDLADSFLSEQLLVETNHEVLRHLETCPACRAGLESHRLLRTTIQRAFMNTDTLRVRDTFARDIGLRLREAGRDDPWMSRRSAVAAAAVAAVAAGTGLLFLPDDLGHIAKDAVGDHRNCAIRFRLADRPIPLAEAGTRHAAWYGRLLDTPPDELALGGRPARVVERHACVFNGRRFAHVVLQVRGQMVSLLVTEDDRWLRRLSRRFAGRRLDSLPAVDGFTVVSFTTTRHDVFFVSNLTEPEIRTIAEGLADPLAQQLTRA